MLETLTPWIIFPLRDKWNLPTPWLAGRPNEIMWRITYCSSDIPNHQGRSGQDWDQHSIFTQCSVLIWFNESQFTSRGDDLTVWGYCKVLFCDKHVTDMNMLSCFKDSNHTSGWSYQWPQIRFPYNINSNNIYGKYILLPQSFICGWYYAKCFIWI